MAAPLFTVADYPEDYDEYLVLNTYNPQTRYGYSMSYGAESELLEEPLPRRRQETSLTNSDEEARFLFGSMNDVNVEMLPTPTFELDDDESISDFDEDESLNGLEVAQYADDDFDGQLAPTPNFDDPATPLTTEVETLYMQFHDGNTYVPPSTFRRLDFE